MSLGTRNPIATIDLLQYLGIDSTAMAAVQIGQIME
jgi:hypothetical protein